MAAAADQAALEAEYQAFWRDAQSLLLSAKAEKKNKLMHCLSALRLRLAVFYFAKLLSQLQGKNCSIFIHDVFFR